MMHLINFYIAFGIVAMCLIATFMIYFVVLFKKKLNPSIDRYVFSTEIMATGGTATALMAIIVLAALLLQLIQ